MSFEKFGLFDPDFFTGDPSKLSLKIFTKQNQRSNLFFDRHPNFLNECVFQIKRFPHYLLSWQTFFSWLLFKVGFICFLRERLSSYKCQRGFSWAWSFRERSKMTSEFSRNFWIVLRSEVIFRKREVQSEKLKILVLILRSYTYMFPFCANFDTFRG